jgi:hypothetical protein
MPKYEPNKMGYLTHIYDGLYFKETRRSREDDLVIAKPNLTILAGTTPSFLGGFLGDEAWEQGFCSRTIFVYSEKKKDNTIFHSAVDRQVSEEGFGALSRDLNTISLLYGEAVWSREAMEAIELWYKEGAKPAPLHGRLQNYNTRRVLHTLKLAIIASMARDNDLIVQLEDFEMAREWLLEAERHMPEIFKRMSVTVEARAIDDAMFRMEQLYAKTGEPVPEHYLIQALISSKIKGTDAPKVADLMVKARRLRLVRNETTGQLWYIPIRGEAN